MLDKPSLPPTSEQKECIDAIANGSGNLLINALAGTGKTTTLDFIQGASPVLPVLCLAFNKSVADEATSRFPSTTTVRTFNSLGHRIWSKSVSSLTLNPKKTAEIIKEVLSSLKGDDKKAASSAWFEISSAVSMAKALGYVPDGKYPQAKRLIDKRTLNGALEEIPSPFISSLIDLVLHHSIKASYSGLIDFNDQIYMPTLFGGTFPRFPLVLVDEAQDLNPTNHALLDKLCKGRVCAVGDPWQSIYGFRGAVQDGMAKIRAKFSMDERTISFSFRCPQAIVENARWRVQNFNWIKEGGLVEILPSLHASDIPDGAAIICRNNAPLFRCAFHLLSAKRSVQVSGSEIGPKLIRIMSRLDDASASQAKVLGRIEEWKKQKLSNSNASATVLDMVECMKVFTGFGATLGQAVAYAEHLFKQQGTIRLMTGHKAKGLEFSTVYHLDPWLIGDDDQELNLRYVIQTRSSDRYFEIDSKDIRW